MDLDLAVTSIMTTDLTSVRRDQKLVDVKHIYERPDFHSHIPVVENDTVVGIVSLVNFMRAIHHATLDDNESVYQDLVVNDIMTPNPVTVSSKSSIRDAVTILAKGQFHSLLIVDNGQLVGLVSTTDLMKELLKN